MFIARVREVDVQIRAGLTVVLWPGVQMCSTEGILETAIFQST